MGQKHCVEIRGLHGQGCVFKVIFALLHAVVYKNAFTTGLQIAATAGYFMIGSNKVSFILLFCSPFFGFGCCCSAYAKPSDYDGDPTDS